MNDNTQPKQLTEDQTVKLEESKAESLPSGDDLALEALSQSGSDISSDDNIIENEGVSDTNTDIPAPPSPLDGNNTVQDDEVSKSNELAETLYSLQNLVERQARQLVEISNEVKEKRDSLKSVFINDTELAEAQAQQDVYSQSVKERRGKMQAEPQVVSLKVQISELNQQKKEIEETLSNHLVNYHQLTNSTSFDTSEGDQWEFSIKAKIKSRK